MSEITKAKPIGNSSVKALVAMPAFRQRFDDVLGREKASAFLGSLTALTTEKSLASCEPKSVIAAAFTAATLDLPIQKNLGFSWIVPYKIYGSELSYGQFQVGWKGYVQLALRTSQYRRLNAFKVNAEAYGGLDEFGEAIIKIELLDDLKPAVGYAVMWELLNKFKKTVYWPKEKCIAHAARFSQSYKSKKKDSPWFTDEDAMCMKTVVANGLKAWGPMSTQMQKAYESDQSVKLEIDSEPEFVDAPENYEEATDVTTNPEPTGTKSDRVVEALKTQAQAVVVDQSEAPDAGIMEDGEEQERNDKYQYDASGQPLCPKCGGPMWNNIGKTTKSGKAGPNWTCKNKNCKWQPSENGLYDVPSDFPTAIWKL